MMIEPKDAAVIRALTSGLRPVKALPPARNRAWHFAAISVAVLAAGVWVFGIRRDLPSVVVNPVFLSQVLLFGAVGTLATIAAMRLSVPAADRAVSRYAAVIVFALWPVALVLSQLRGGGALWQLVSEPLHRSCVNQIMWLSLVPGVALMMMVRRGATLDAAWAGLMAGAATAAIGAFGVSLSCPVLRLPHLFMSHLVPSVFVAIIIAALFSAVGRRRAPAVALAILVSCFSAAVSLSAQSASTPSALPSFSVVKSTVGYVKSDEFLAFLASTTQGSAQAALDGGPLLIGVVILLGGLLLNLTPCVLPMIPINLAIIGAGEGSTSRRRGWILGATYGGAMALVYGVLGAVIVITTGTFGVLNSSPWFNAGIALLFVVLGLAMFDVFTLDFSALSGRVNLDGQRRGSLWLAFFMGGIAALLAGACVAPVVIQVIALSSRLYSGGSNVALALPLILGLGMGLPWPFAGAGIAALPKPGAWMVRVKQGLGVLILLTAVYYGYEAIRPLLPKPAVVAGAENGSAEDGWYDSLEAGLVAAQREGKPVFLDVWATWCKNCVVMNATTFKDPKVLAALDGYVKVRFQAEDVERPDAAALLDRLDSIGLPTYAVLKPASE